MVLKGTAIASMSYSETKGLLALLGLLFFPLLASFWIPILWKIIGAHWLTFLLYFCLALYATRVFTDSAKGSFEEKPDLSSKTVVITGAAAGGIGFPTSVTLAKLGARVIVGVRGAERAVKTASEIASAAGVSSDKVVGLHLDLSSLKEVKQFANQVSQRTDRIDILINNAGVMMCPFSETKDGLEMQMGTNHFGHFYLTQLLMPTLLKSKARIVCVSSSGHAQFSNGDGIEFAAMSNKDTYNMTVAYGNSKLANVYHAYELQQRYGSQGIKAYSLHPGGITTNLQRHNAWMVLMAPLINALVLKSLEQGSHTSLTCALSDKAVPGLFHADCKQFDTNIDSEKARKWWEFSEEVIAAKTRGF